MKKRRKKKKKKKTTVFGKLQPKCRSFELHSEPTRFPVQRLMKAMN